MSQTYLLAHDKDDTTIYLSRDGFTFTEDEELAWHFSDPTAVQAQKELIKTSTYVKKSGEDTTILKLPPPDFFEVLRVNTALHVLSILNDSDFDYRFTPVKEITGSDQMTSSLRNNRAEGYLERKYIFSFSGVFLEPEIIKLKDSNVDNKWHSITVEHFNEGLGQYHTVTLTAKTKFT